MFQESSSLWYIEVLKGIYRNRDQGMLRLLLNLSDPYYIKCISLLILHCRGDEEDPFIRFLMALYQLSAELPSSRPAETKFGHRTKDIIQAYKVFGRTFLAALSPLLLHTYLTRRKGDPSMVHPCHNLMPILYDVERLARQLNEDGEHVTSRRKEDGMATVPLAGGMGDRMEPSRQDVTAITMSRDRPEGCLDDTSSLHAHSGSLDDRQVASPTHSILTHSGHHCSFRGGLVRRLFWRIKTPLQKRILSRDSIESILDFVSSDEILKSMEFLSTVVNDESYRMAPVDNFSGLEHLLVKLASLSIQGNRTVDSSRMPGSLYEFYQQIPEHSKPIRNVVKSALIYVYRLRNMDLEYKMSRKKIMREIIKNAQSPKGRSRHYVQQVETSKDDIHPGHLSDIGIVELFRKCVLLFEEYFPVLNKVCDADSHVNIKVYGLAEKSLSLTYRLLKKISRQHSLGCSGPIGVSPIKFVYGTFIGLIYSTFGMKFAPVSPRDLVLGSLASQSHDHPADRMGSMEDGESECSNDEWKHSNDEWKHSNDEWKHSNDEWKHSNGTGYISATFSKGCAPLSRRVEERSVGHSSLNAFIENMRTREKRIFITEELALAVLKVHANVFRVVFTNLNVLMEIGRRLTGQMEHKRNGCTNCRSSGEPSNSKGSEGSEDSDAITPSATLIHSSAFRSHLLAVGKLPSAYAQFLPDYIVYAKTHETFRRCRERFAVELFPKANYLIISHMDRLEYKPVPMSAHPLY